MAANTRTKLQIACDRAEIAEMNAEGMTEQAIADVMGMTQQMVHYDLVKVRDEYSARADDAVAKKAALFDARNEELYQVSLGEYEKSRETDDTAGDPRFLQAAAQRLDRYAKFHGLDAPDKAEVTTIATPKLPEDVDMRIRVRYANRTPPDTDA